MCAGYDRGRQGGVLHRRGVRPLLDADDITARRAGAVKRLRRLERGRLIGTAGVRIGQTDALGWTRGRHLDNSDP